jgi:hypothetical protein
MIPIFFAKITYQSNRVYKSVEEALLNHWLLRHVLEERSFLYDRRSKDLSCGKNLMQCLEFWSVPEEMMLNVVDMWQSL